MPVHSIAQHVDLLWDRIAHYPMDSGAHDISGFDNHGLVSGAVLSPDRKGRAGQAYYFDGEDDYINCGTGIEAITSSLSASCWIKTDGTKVSSHILSKYNSDSDAGFILGLQDGRLMLAGRNSSDQYIRLTSRSRIDDDRWHHVMGIIDGNFWSLYVDGILENQLELHNRRTIMQNTEALILGKYIQGNNGDHMHYKGFLDEVIIYKRALNECEIEVLYTGDRGVR